MMSVSLIVLFCLAVISTRCHSHVVHYGVKGHSDGKDVPLARVQVEISLGSNASSSGLTSRLVAGPKGEKGGTGKAGPPGRPAPENKCSCNCCHRLDDMEERLANLTLLVEKIQNTTDSELNEKRDYRSCQEARERGATVSGVYTLDLGDGMDPFQVYCDMKTDGGGWTVFQRRQDGSVDFYRGWSDYKKGFGDLNGEFWLGLDKIHRLTKQQQLLRIDLGDFDGNKTYAKYTDFVVENESRKYAMTFSQYSGNAGDSLAYQKGMMFTTKDSDNEPEISFNCASKFSGAWWYKMCHTSNLNGIYSTDKSASSGRGIVWYHWKSNYQPMKLTEMKLRPKYN